MNLSKEMSIDTLEMVLVDYIRDNAASIAKEMMEDLMVQCVAENHMSESDNDGIDIIIKVKVPGTSECDRLLESRYLKTPGSSGDI